MKKVTSKDKDEKEKTTKKEKKEEKKENKKEEKTLEKLDDNNIEKESKKEIKKEEKTTKKDSFQKEEVLKTIPKKQLVFRLIIYAFLFIISSFVCFLFASRTLEREELAPIIYNQNGNIEYKVYLNPNKFYTEEYLGMNKAYIASLIKYLDINYSYIFNIGDTTNIDFEYRIRGDLIIENTNGSKRYLERTYDITEAEKAKIIDGRHINIKKNVQIDYNYYNQLANNFKYTYGVDTNSYINIYLNVVAKTKDNNTSYNINEDHKVLLKVPLSEKALEINLDTNSQSITKQITPLGEMIFNKTALVLEIIFLVISSIFMVICIKLIFKIFSKNLTNYDRFINKVLKEYDRLVVETFTKLDLSKYNIIKVEQFTELLDVRDNLKQPIIYYNVVKHMEGIFYIKDYEDVFLLEVKDEDLQDNKNLL